MSGSPLITPAAPYLLTRNAPRYLVAVFNALRFDEPSTDGLRRLNAADWEALLQWCDARQLTLMLPWLGGAALPVEIRAQIEWRQTRYAERFSRLKRELFEITETLKELGIECIVLKGLTHSPAFTEDPLFRAAGDIDLWIRGDEIWTAREALVGLGYASFKKAKSRHLAPLLRPNGWKWRGDRFDPEIPIAVELHYELWSESSERVAAPGTDRFWDRSIHRTFDGHVLRTLREEDLLGFAALHLLAHLLHGDLPLQRAWELANFLHQRAPDEAFWSTWLKVHPARLRNLEVLVFQLVRNWFGCALSRTVQRDAEALSGRVCSWLNTFSFSPLMRQFHPNKDELWLHLALASPANRARIALRRLLPLQIPGFVDEFDDRSRLRKLRCMFRQRDLIAERATYHLRTLLPTIAQGTRWLVRKS